MKSKDIIKNTSKKNSTLAKSFSKKLLTNEQVQLVSGAAICKDCRTNFWTTGSDGITRQKCDEFYC